jgi:hypothetical protein
MSNPKKKKSTKDEEMDDDRRHVSINDLASFTRSEVVEELKLGLSRLGPLEDESRGEPY